jgi:hypothetical protein
MESKLYQPLYITYVVEFDGVWAADYLGPDQNAAYQSAADRAADGFEARVGTVTFEACFNPKEPA